MNLKNLNLAELFAISRIFTFPVVLFFIIIEARTLAGWLYIIFFSTDFIDGFFARFFNMESARRARLDSLGDIFFLAVGVLGFFLFEKDYFLNHISWIIIFSGLYLLEFVFSLIKYRRPTNYHTYSAKLAAFSFAAFLSVTILWEPVDWLFYVTFFLGMIENMEEISLTTMLKRWQPNIKSIFFISKNR